MVIGAGLDTGRRACVIENAAAVRGHLSDARVAFERVADGADGGQPPRLLLSP